MIPESTKTTLDLYVQQGIPTGDFLYAGDICETSTGVPYLTEIKYKKMFQNLPQKYLGDFKNLRFYNNPSVTAD